MEETEEVYEAALEAIRANQAACLLVVVEAMGSTPRGVGAKMLLRTDGSTVGTIGGGVLEKSALADAQAALGSGTSRVMEYSLAGRSQCDVGVCGGKSRVFIEVLRPKPTLLIAGGGHVAQPLAEFAHLLGFRTVVVDDRAEFATVDRFPHADELLVTPFEELSERVSLTPSTFVVIVTRGHQFDGVVLRQVVSERTAYVGMIGSRSKVRTVFGKLVREGVPKDRLARVHAPIGLRTGGQTPAEIALSIMAEIVVVQHGGTGEPHSWRDNPMRPEEALP